MTIKLVGGGQGLELSIAGGDQGFPFCNSNDSQSLLLRGVERPRGLLVRNGSFWRPNAC